MAGSWGVGKRNTDSCTAAASLASLRFQRTASIRTAPRSARHLVIGFAWRDRKDLH